MGLDTRGGGDTVAALLAVLTSLHPDTLALILCAAAAVTWYIAVLAAADAGAGLGGRGGSITLGFVVGGGLPVTAAACATAFVGAGQVGMCLVIGAAVASVTLVLGLISNVNPQRPHPTRRQRRTDLASLLPVAVTLLIAGFAGVFTITQALLLLIEGAIVVWIVARTRSEPMEPEDLEQPTPGPSPVWAAVVQLLLATILAVAGAGLGLAATRSAGGLFGRNVDALFASIFFAAVMLLPLIGLGTGSAAAGHQLAVQRGLVLLSCLLLTTALPAVILISAFRTMAVDATETAAVAEVVTATQPVTAPVLAPPDAEPQTLLNLPVVAVPPRIWRVDSVLLCVVGLLLLPAAAGRFRVGRPEGIGLILLYVGYLVLSVAMSR